MGEGDIEQPVLVRILKFIKDAQGRRERFIRSMVRLRPLDQCLRLNAEISNSGPLLLECGGGFNNGELEPLHVRRRIDAALLDSQGVNDVVECGSQIVNTVGSDKRPPIE